jgi:hypothetical protein
MLDGFKNQNRDYYPISQGLEFFIPMCILNLFSSVSAALLKKAHKCLENSFYPQT